MRIQVQADALEALGSLARSSAVACHILLESGGLELAFECRKSSNTLVRRKGLDLVGAALLGEGGEAMKDRFSNRNLYGSILPESSSLILECTACHATSEL
eukprot:2992086-Rhodomonas_salina.4